MTADAARRGARPRAVLARVFLLLAVVAQLLTCQAVGTADRPVPALAQDAQHGVGHDPLCEAAPLGNAAPNGPSLGCRVAVPDTAPIVLLAQAFAALLLAVSSAVRAGAPSAPARALTGRRRLLDIDVIRV